MNKKIFLICILLLSSFIILIGCTSKNPNYDKHEIIITGTIIKVSDNSILITQNKSADKKYIAQSMEELLKDPEAKLININSKDFDAVFEKGQKVKVITNTIMESYPEQAKALDIEILE